ncbi:MAG TPA: dipeptidyl carboxypeptidase II, partial [Rheinheimera sp.]|nr:dipeptidyl carboxypeptidase II [Rheinheimera sp.]
MRKTLIATTVGAALALAACSDNTAPQQETAQQPAAEVTTAAEVVSSNPLMVKSTLQYEAPNFNEIKDDHFLPAFEEGMKQHMTEVLAIAANPEPATFDNTLVALEKSGELLTRVSRIFYNLAGSSSNPQ